MLNKLKTRNIENFTFNESSHTYELGGKLLTGVTTILQVRNQPFLKWWPVKLMYEFLKDKQEVIKGLTPKAYENLLEQGKKLHTVRSKEALLSGKIAHDWIEKHIEGAELPMPEDKKAAESIKRFLEWEEKNKVEWLASELRLPSQEYLFAGSVDGVARIGGFLTVVDFKTSNQISEDYFLQTAAYWLLLNENLEEGEPRPEERLILRIPKTGEDFEAKLVPTPLKFDCETFLHLREAHKWGLLVERLRNENK